MSDWAETALPCPKCPSSDAMSVNDRGWATCFSCGESWKMDGDYIEYSPKLDGHRPLVPKAAIECVGLKSRNLRQETLKKYGYGVAEFRNRKTHVAPYHDDKGRVVAQKIRAPNKEFTTTGDLKKAGLFGQQLCRSGGKMIVITEGEIDAMSACQALGLSWPAVSVPNGSSGARKALGAQLEWLETFEKVVLAFDNDDPGRKATEDCLDLFSPGKVAIADLGDRKDPNEFLVDGREKELREAIWSAHPWRPDGVVNMAEMRERVQRELSLGTEYPWSGLNDLLYGFRECELITWCAGTGVGKTAIISELVYHLIRTDHKVGIIYLEEGIDRAGRRIVGLDMDKPIHLPGVEYTEEEFAYAWNRTLGIGNLFAYDHFGSLDKEILISRVRYMVKVLGCQVIFLDHISMVVSGMDLQEDERRMLDSIMTALRSLSQETGATINVVSHLSRPSGNSSHEEGLQVSLRHLRGTQAIAQLSDAVIAAERNQQDKDAKLRNTTVLRVLKNRYAGLTGKACLLEFDRKTGRLNEKDDTFDDLQEEVTDDF